MTPGRNRLKSFLEGPQHGQTAKDGRRSPSRRRRHHDRLASAQRKRPPSEETAKRIRWAIEKLDYRPNEVARALRGIKTHTIGIIVPYLWDPFFATCAHEVYTVAKSFGYSVIVSSSDEDPVVEENEFQKMMRRHIDGLIITPCKRDATYMDRKDPRPTPLVTMDRPLSNRRFSSVLVQNKSGARLGVEHLIEHGHRRIAFVGVTRSLYTMEQRYAGYREAMAAAGLDAAPYMDHLLEDAMPPFIRSLHKSGSHFTAIFCGNNYTTRQVFLQLRSAGIRVPQQVALVGFDDFDTADLLEPAITVVRQPARELGRLAADILFERIRSGATSVPSRSIVLPVELVIRSSCGCHTR